MRTHLSHVEFTCDRCGKCETPTDAMGSGWFFLSQDSKTGRAPFAADLCSGACLLAYVDRRREAWAKP